MDPTITIADVSIAFYCFSRRFVGQMNRIEAQIHEKGLVFVVRRQQAYRLVSF